MSGTGKARLPGPFAWGWDVWARAVCYGAFAALASASSAMQLVAVQADSPIQHRLQDEPAVALGGLDGQGPEEFSNVVAIASSSDGSLIIGDAASSEVRVFDAEGSFVRRFGGFGRGPGEIPGLWSLWRWDREICALDVSQAVHCFSDDGRFLRTFRTFVSQHGTRVSWVGSLESGSLVGLSQDPTRRVRVGAEIRQPATVVRTTGPEDRELFTLGTGPGTTGIATSGGGMGLSIVFSPELKVAVFGERVCFGDTGSGEIRCVGANGVAVGTFSVPETARRVSRAERDAYFAGLAEANPDDPGFIERARREIPFAEDAPRFGRLVAGQDGRLWVGEFLPTDWTQGPIASSPDPMRWVVYDMKGQAVGSLVVPGRFRLMSAGSGWVAGVLRDDLGVETVVLWPYSGN